MKKSPKKSSKKRKNSKAASPKTVMPMLVAVVIFSFFVVYRNIQMMREILQSTVVVDDIPVSELESASASDLSKRRFKGTDESSIAAPEATDPTTQSEGNNAQTKKSRFAYLFLLGGVDTSQNGYKGYLLNMWIAAYLLRLTGSTADIIVMLQFAKGMEDGELTPLELHITKDLGIQIRMLDAASTANSFNGVIMEKLRIFQLTEYERVIFFDGDAYPFCSIDYLFEASTKPTAPNEQRIFMDNFIQAGAGAPMNAGMFMVRPEEGDWEALQAIIRHRDLVNGTTFDPSYGWGHRIKSRAEGWISWNKSGNRNWHFYAGEADQGILYHYLRYVKGSLTQSASTRFRVWDAVKTKRVKNRNGKMVEEKIAEQTFLGDADPLGQLSCIKQLGFNFSKPAHTTPCSDYEHFFGGFKPWLKHNDRYQDVSFVPKTLLGSKSPTNLWFVTLRHLIKLYNITYLDVDRWDQTTKTSLGKTKIGFNANAKDFGELVAQRAKQTEAK